MTDVIIIAVVAVLIFLAARYIYKEKKAGKVCVGCPHSGSCGGNCSGGCSGQKKQ